MKFTAINRLKRTLLLLASRSLMAVLLPLSAWGGENQGRETPAVLVAKGAASAPIIVAEDAPPHTVEAVEELARLMERISGRRPQILNAPPEPLPPSVLWVGPHPKLGGAMPGVDFKLDKPEETLIVSKGGHVAILGNDRMANGVQISSGTANAVYSFLRDQLNVRWLWPGQSGEDVIESQTILIPELTTRYAPVFLQRKLFYRMDRDEEQKWAIHQGIGYYSYKAPMGHSFHDWWEKYSKSHPEYFALQPDGSRSGFPKPNHAKVCEGEPAVWRQWLENVAEEFKKDPATRVFGASQNDGSNLGVCMDPRSKAWDHPDGPLQQYVWAGKTDTYVAQSDRMVHFANTLGAMLDERFPGEGLQVLVMAYGLTKTAPVEARPRENVGISYVGQFPTSSDKWREIEKAQFASWSEKADFLVFRPNLFYYSGGWHGLPVITSRVLGEDFRFLADHHCRGIMVDGVPNHWGPQGLQYYLMARLLWKPHQEVEPMVEEYCQRGFGSAASKVRDYFALMEKAQMAVLNHPEWFPGMGTTRDPLSEAILPEAFTPELLEEGDKLLAQAALELKEAPQIYRDRLELLQRSQQFTRLMMNTVLTMNEVRHSKGRNVEAVEEATRLVKAREAFFAEEKAAASSGRRPAAVDAHRIRTTWIENRKLQDWLGPVSEEFLRAAAEAKASGESVVSDWKANRKAPERKPARLANPVTLRWTGSAGDGSWQNRGNWEALAVTGQWVPAPNPPDEGAKVELGNAAVRPGEQVLRLGRDVELESITINASGPVTSYRIRNRQDADGGIDADSSRLSVLVLKARTPIVQTNRARASLEIDVPIRFSDPAAKMDLRSEHGAKVRLELPAASPGAPDSAASSPAGPPAMPPVFGKGPLVLFGDSCTALRGGTKTYGERLKKSFEKWHWPVQIVNAGVPGNTTEMAGKRFKRDVLDRDPSLVVIQFGINDAAVDVWKDPPASEPRVSLSDYRKNLESFVDEIQSRGAEVVLMTPNAVRWTPQLLERYGKPPYVPEDEKGFDILLAEYAGAVREVARSKGVPLVDVHAAYADGSAGSAQALLTDGMHPSNKGHELVERLLLTQWIGHAAQTSLP